MKPRLTHLNQELELRESPHLRQEESRCPSTCQCIGGGGMGRSPDQSSSSVRIRASHLRASIWTQRRDPRNIETDPRLKVRVQLGVVQHLTFRVPGSWSQGWAGANEVWVCAGASAHLNPRERRSECRAYLLRTRRCDVHDRSH